ncbi:SAMHD1 [Mytilus coruscus]|uniref:SAMHD1 n=1 Tax=Mytilus coruscus TaxID=42192 RepID=A0A6J8AFR6_MYTCO|nr:SAMHD1 [Mytilus coruscus]
MSKILNDPIHGTIELDSLLISIIDTPQFQRLRNIKQLGGCYFVYPSASHNRFEHSIGTCFLASKLARQLQKRLEKDIKKLEKDGNDEKKTKLEKAEMSKNDKLCIEIAALCHDIGHGPYSHLFDRLFNKAMKKKDPSTVEWKHEDVSRMMIDYMIKENDDLKEAFQMRFGADTERSTEFIKDLIDGTQKETEDKAKYYMYEIVANKRNEIDVDKMDYFARDCHGLGMKSNFDHLRFISQCRVMFSSDTPDETTIAVRDKEKYNLYELFHTRIGLFRRAYYHKVTKAVELMFTDALVKSNDHFLFQNNKGEDVKMSEAWEHPEVYKIQGENDKLESLLLQTELTEDDFAVQKVTYSYGKGPDNPITSVYFYTKENDTDCFASTKSNKTSLFLPETFQEEFLRVYSKNDEKIDILKKETTVCLKQITKCFVKREDVKMSEAWEHPEVYVKLTDSVFDGILMEKNPKKDMRKAQELINNVYKLKLYRRVDETSPVKKIQGKNDKLESLLLQTELTEDDFAVQKVTYSYGKGPDNPITSVYFYTKDNDTDCFPSTTSKKTSLFLSETFQEEILRVYSKNDEKIDVLKKETTKCLIQVALDSVKNLAIKQEHQGIAAPGTGTKQ